MSMTTGRTIKRDRAVVVADGDWDPDVETTTELAERLGMSRQRSYQILDREHVTQKSQRGDASPALGVGPASVPVDNTESINRLVWELGLQGPRVRPGLSGASQPIRGVLAVASMVEAPQEVGQ